MKITDTNEIKAANAKFQPAADGAYATCRCLPGQYDRENQQEWAERGTIDGKAATVFYVFDNSEAEAEDGSDMPFDVDHITHIEIEAEDEEEDEIEAEPKTLLTMEVGNSREMKWEIGTEDSDGNYSEVRSGSLAPEGDLEALEELKSEVDEVWECSSLVTSHNLRKA